MSVGIVDFGQGEFLWLSHRWQYQEPWIDDLERLSFDAFYQSAHGDNHLSPATYADGGGARFGVFPYIPPSPLFPDVKGTSPALLVATEGLPCRFSRLAERAIPAPCAPPFIIDIRL
jgi:hypothetical protein